MMRSNALILMACVLLATITYAGEQPHATKSKVCLEHSTRLPDYDRIRIYALEGQPTRDIDGFPILPYKDAVCKIVAEKEVTGKQALEICAAWRKLNDESNRAMCHLPPYGFRFYQGDRMVFQTSICWKCNNYYGPDEKGNSVWYGMATDKESAALLKLCRKLLPHPKSKK